MIRVPVEGIRFASRASKGVRVFDTAEDEKVVSVEHIPDPGEGENGNGGDDAAGGENRAGRAAPPNSRNRRRSAVQARFSRAGPIGWRQRIKREQGGSCCRSMHAPIVGRCVLDAGDGIVAGRPRAGAAAGLRPRRDRRIRRHALPTLRRRCGTTVAEPCMAANPQLPSQYFLLPGMRIQMPPPAATAADAGQHHPLHSTPRRHAAQHRPRATISRSPTSTASTRTSTPPICGRATSSACRAGIVPPQPPPPPAGNSPLHCPSRRYASKHRARAMTFRARRSGGSILASSRGRCASAK